MIDSPRVTVLMSVYNGAAYLRQAVESILAQSFQDFEFVIVNDGSTDDSRAILASYSDARIRVLDNVGNIGLTRSLNRGLSHARGELVARQDADDVSQPVRLAHQVSFMDLNPEIALVGTQARYIYPDGIARTSKLWWKATTIDAVKFQALFTSPFFHTSVMYRRGILWETLGGYNEDFRTSQDFELWSRLIQRYAAVNLDQYLVDQRAHTKSLSANYTLADLRGAEQVLKSNLESVLTNVAGLEAWPSTWLRALVLGIPVSGDQRRIHSLAGVAYDRFVAAYCPSRATREIRQIQAANLMAVSRSIFARAPMQAICALSKALRVSTFFSVGEMMMRGVGLMFRWLGALRVASRAPRAQSLR